MNEKFNILSTKILEPAIIQTGTRLGFRIEEIPFIEIQFLQGNSVEEEWKQICLLPQKKLLAFTSKNAVDAFVSIMSQNSNSIVSRTTIAENWPIASISGRTMEEVQKEFPGARSIAIARNASQLAQAISEKISKEYLVVFPCGDIHRPELPEQLRLAEFNVHEWIVYRTLESPHKIQNSFQGILFFSPSAVESFFSTNKLNSTTICFAVGDSTASAIKKYSSNKLLITNNPSQESMIELLESYFIDRKQDEPLGKNKNEAK